MLSFTLTLAMVYMEFLLPCLISFLGFGPEGGRSPAEHRGNLYVRTSVRTSVPPLAKGLTEAGLGLPKAGWGLQEDG